MIEDARVEALLMQRLPGVRRWFLQAQPAHDPHGLDVPSLLARLGRALLDDSHADGNHWVHKGRTLFAATRTSTGTATRSVFPAKQATKLAIEITPEFIKIRWLLAVARPLLAASWAARWRCRPILRTHTAVIGLVITATPTWIVQIEHAPNTVWQ